MLEGKIVPTHKRARTRKNYIYVHMCALHAPTYNCAGPCGRGGVYLYFSFIINDLLSSVKMNFVTKGSAVILIYIYIHIFALPASALVTTSV